MSWLLDTNTCIFAMKGHARVLERLREHDPSELAVSTVTLAELWFGAKKSKKPDATRRLVDAFLAPLAVLAFDRGGASRYADVRHHLEQRGEPIGERDQLIACTALAWDRTLVTSNVQEFRRVPSLRIVDWAAVPRR